MMFVKPKGVSYRRFEKMTGLLGPLGFFVFVFFFLDHQSLASLLSSPSVVTQLPTSPTTSATRKHRKPVLVLDIDGTVYEDNCLIETQIRENCWVFGRKIASLSEEQCEEMHHKVVH